MKSLKAYVVDGNLKLYGTLDYHVSEGQYYEIMKYVEINGCYIDDLFLHSCEFFEMFDPDIRLSRIICNMSIEDFIDRYKNILKGE